MFSIKESFKYGWAKFKENSAVCLTTSLFLLAISFLMIEKGGIGVFFFNLALTVLILIVRIGYTKVFLDIHDGKPVEFVDIFKHYKLFFRYLAVSILTPLAVLGGFILLIIPGLIWMVRFSFASMILVDKNIGPVMAMKESYAMTKGMFWKLVLFGISICLVNLLGFFALMVGLLVTLPVSTFAIVYVYKIINQKIVPISEQNTPSTTLTN